MKRLIPMLLLCAFASSARAQDPFDDALPVAQLQPSTNTWESQDPRFDTPKQAVRRKAAWKGAQRRQRLESLKRIGYSPSRPPSASVPYMSSPRPWVIFPSYYLPLAVIYQSQAPAPAVHVVR